MNVESVMYVNGTAYRVDRLLGKGKGGYSYLARDPLGLRAVVKQIHHEPCSYYTFGDKLAAELSDYERLRVLGIPMPALLDVDIKQERLVKSYVNGRTVYELVLAGELPEWCLDAVKEMCSVLYPAGLNIDYFPTNFIPEGDVLYYIDYEANKYEKKWDFEHWGSAYWSLTPELMAYQAQRHAEKQDGIRE